MIGQRVIIILKHYFESHHLLVKHESKLVFPIRKPNTNFKNFNKIQDITSDAIKIEPKVVVKHYCVGFDFYYIRRYLVQSMRRALIRINT